MADFMPSAPVSPDGGLSSTVSPEQADPKTDPAVALLETLEKDFKRLRSQKARPTGGVEGSTLLNLCFLHDEQYVRYQSNQLSLEPKDANRLYLTFNLIKPRFQKLSGRLSAFNAPFKARADRKDPEAWSQCEIVDRMIKALDEKLDEPSRMRERIYWMLVSGVAVEYTPWIPNATIEPMPQFQNGELLFEDIEQPDGSPSRIIPQSLMEQLVGTGRPPESFKIYESIETVGEVGSEILSPFNVFIDQSVRDIGALSPDQWVHIARPKTVGWIKENFPDTGQDIEASTELSLISSRILPEGESTGGMFLKDLLPLVQGSCGHHDPPMVILVESYQAPSTDNPHGQYACWVPGQSILFSGPNPYDEIPLTDFHFEAATTSFWSRPYVSPLIAPQRFINKRMNQLGEQANAAVYSQILLGPGLTEADIPADYPGAIKNGLNEDGSPNVGRLAGPELPAWFLPSIQLAIGMFNDVAGGVDLMEDNKFPGQLRGPMAVPMLQEILDTQWGPLFSHLGERLARVKQLRLNRVKQFYPPTRTMHYTARDQRDEVMTFMTDKILRSGTNFNITVDRGALMPELRALREARITERLNGPLALLYIDERTGQLDKSKIAADLAFGETGREAREAKYRKLSQEIIKMLWQGQPPPPVQPFYDHASMLDELEDAMATTEFLRSSPQVQQLFIARWQEHEQYLQMAAQAQQQTMMSTQMHSALAQATQQAAAQAASEAVHEAMAQAKAQQAQPTAQYVAQAESQAGINRPPTPKPSFGGKVSQ